MTWSVTHSDCMRVIEILELREAACDGSAYMVRIVGKTFGIHVLFLQSCGSDTYFRGGLVPKVLCSFPM